MNVFVCTSSNLGSMFNITTGTKKDNVYVTDYNYNEAFALSLADDGERTYECLSVNYKNNFYNLDPNCKYKITTLKIGDTYLSDADLSDKFDDLNISSTNTRVSIDANISKTWVKSVYKQCAGKELELSYFKPADPIISTIPVSITFTKVTQ